MFRYYAGWATKVAGQDDPDRRPATSSRTRCASPSASCGRIIPWNFPLMMAGWKLAPGARRAATRSIMKPAEQTPLSALRLARADRRGRLARRRRERRQRPGRDHRCRRSSTIRTSTRSRSPARPRSARRHEDPTDKPQARHALARWKSPERLSSRTRPDDPHRRRGLGHLLQHGTGLHRRVPPVRGSRASSTRSIERPRGGRQGDEGRPGPMDEETDIGPLVTRGADGSGARLRGDRPRGGSDPDRR